MTVIEITADIEQQSEGAIKIKDETRMKKVESRNVPQMTYS